MGMHGHTRCGNLILTTYKYTLIKSVHWATWRRLNEHCNYSGLLVMKQSTATSRISVFQNSCHMFNFDCRFTHMSHIWPDRNFNDELNGNCCKVW